MLLSTYYLSGMGIWLFALAGVLVVLLRWRRRSRLAARSQIWPHMALSAWIVLVTLTIPEIACALFYDSTDSLSQTNVSQRWFKRHVIPNLAGYRDVHELPDLRSPSKLYVTFVGDSFTFGHGIKNVSDRFSDRIASALTPEKVVVSNAGLPGMEILQIVDRQVPELTSNKIPIDLLVYTFVPNDIEWFYEPTAEFYQRVAARSPSFFLWKETYFYNLLYHRMQSLWNTSGGEYYRFLSASYEAEPWDLFTLKLEHLQARCHEHQIRLHIMIFPFLTLLGDHDPFTTAYAKMETYCAEQKIPCTNLTATLTTHRDEGLVISRYDSHPNARAHALAAEALLPDLRKQLQEIRDSTPRHR